MVLGNWLILGPCNTNNWGFARDLADLPTAEPLPSHQPAMEIYATDEIELSLLDIGKDTKKF